MPNKNQISIETTVDITCPFCMLSTYSLQLALDRWTALELDTPIKVKVNTFLLHPDMSMNAQPFEGLMKAKFGEERVGIMLGMIKAKFAEVGLKANQLLISSPIPAHRLIAKTPQPAQFPLTLALMKAYHTAGKAPCDVDMLVHTAVQYGVFKDDQSARKFIQSDKLEKDVKRESEKAREAGVRSVPIYVFQGKDEVMGAKTTEEFMQLFRQYAA